jgi:hypothetical protein
MKRAMTIMDLRQDREDLRKKIQEAVDDFERETGLQVYQIDIERIDTSPVSATTLSPPIVQIEIRLP